MTLVSRHAGADTIQMPRESGRPIVKVSRRYTYVRADNLASLAFHLKLGFRIIGTAPRQAKFNGKYVDELLVEKSL
jgi:RimJ/RimL family protein N-acetyltransferase